MKCGGEKRNKSTFAIGIRTMGVSSVARSHSNRSCIFRLFYNGQVGVGHSSLLPAPLGLPNPSLEQSSERSTERIAKAIVNPSTERIAKDQGNGQ